MVRGELDSAGAVAAAQLVMRKADMKAHPKADLTADLTADVTADVTSVTRIDRYDSYYYARRFDEAIDLYRQAIEFSPDFMQVRFDLGRSLEQAGRYEEALMQFEIGLGMANADRGTSPALACTYGFSGRPDLARPILAALKAKAGEHYVPPYAIASVHAALGETDQALDWLERAYAKHDRAMIYLGVNPRFDRLRASPRFEALVEQMRLFA